jgi:hypothetical protein
MADFSLEPILRALAAEFERLGMQHHLEQLRMFYRAHRARKRWLSGQARPPWDVELTLQWACVLRVPPFERVYPVLGDDAPCPQCSAARDALTGTTVRLAWQGGWLMQCQRCDARWIVLRV